MINKCFWDLDENLISTSYSDPDQKHIRFALELGDIYYTIVRPCAKRLIEYSRGLVGINNVYILTAATAEYAQEINKLANFGFPNSHILAREDIHRHSFATAYGGSATVASEHAHIDNVLIDNLPTRDNQEKISFLGMWRSIDTNYFKVKDYYGVNFPDDPFEEDVMNFIDRVHSSPSLCKQEGEKESLEV